MNSNPNAEKRALRREMVRTILALDPQRRLQEELALLDRFERLPGFSEASMVLLYVAHFPEEVPTRPLLQRGLELGKTVICPRVDRVAKRLRLHHVQALDADLTPGVLGIEEPRLDREEVEPESIDWVLMPGLAFDRFGYRLGRGGGYYDWLLPMLRPEVLRWALAFEVQCVEALPVEPHDQPIDGVSTATRLIDLRPARALRMRNPIS